MTTSTRRPFVMSNQESRRRYFRFRYPLAERPELQVGEQNFAVTELSEGGFRFQLPQQASAEFLEVFGQIHFRDGGVELIRGRVLRQFSDEVVVELEEQIPLSRVIAEQRYLARNYPGFLDQ